MIRTTMLAVFALAAVSATAAVDSCGFEKVPRDALVNLQEARGKTFSSGAVFINGHYLKPPYAVSRYGTALSINGNQVSGQIVSWARFVNAKSAPATYAPPRTTARKSTAAAGSLDDLFDDDSSSPSYSPSYSATAAAAEPAATGPFEHTDRTKKLLDSINAERANLDRSLRQQKFFFFSPRYSTVSGNFDVFVKLMDVLPEALRDSNSPDEMLVRLRRAGLGFMSAEVCADLFRNKRDYADLLILRNRVRDEHETRKLLNKGSVL